MPRDWTKVWPDVGQNALHRFKAFRREAEEFEPGVDGMIYGLDKIQGSD
jgi:hypothetical protein